MSWYETIAKKGLLGAKAKVSAESGKADWSTKEKSEVEKARDKVIHAAVKTPKEMGS